MKKYLIFGLVICLLLTGCGNKTKEVKSVDDFSTIAKENNFVVSNNINSYDDSNYITEAMIATYDDISIEMVIYDTNDNANKVQSNQIDGFNLLKSTGASEKRDEGKNYYKYFLISNNYYMVSSRVDNTLIFCKTLMTNKDKVDKILNELGY